MTAILTPHELYPEDRCPLVLRTNVWEIRKISAVQAVIFPREKLMSGNIPTRRVGKIAWVMLASRGGVDFIDEYGILNHEIKDTIMRKSKQIFGE